MAVAGTAAAATVSAVAVVAVPGKPDGPVGIVVLSHAVTLWLVDARRRRRRGRCVAHMLQCRSLCPAPRSRGVGMGKESSVGVCAPQSGRAAGCGARRLARVWGWATGPMQPAGVAVGGYPGPAPRSVRRFCPLPPTLSFNNYSIKNAVPFLLCCAPAPRKSKPPWAVRLNLKKKKGWKRKQKMENNFAGSDSDDSESWADNVWNAAALGHLPASDNSSRVEDSDTTYSPADESTHSDGLLDADWTITDHNELDDGDAFGYTPAYAVIDLPMRSADALPGSAAASSSVDVSAQGQHDVLGPAGGRSRKRPRAESGTVRCCLPLKLGVELTSWYVFRFYSLPTEAAPASEDSSEGSEGSKKRDTGRRSGERAFVRAWHQWLLAAICGIVGWPSNDSYGDGVVELGDRVIAIMAHVRRLRTWNHAPRWPIFVFVRGLTRIGNFALGRFLSCRRASSTGADCARPT